MASECTVEDCTSDAKCKGLCSKHYMRARRTGDPTATRRPGRPKDAYKARQRSYGINEGWSERTFSRYVTATRTIAELDGDTLLVALAEATRANGSINVAALERAAERAIVCAVAEAV